MLSSFLFFLKYDKLGAPKSPWALFISQTQPQKCGHVVQYIKEPLKNKKYINSHGISERSMGVVRYTLSTH